MTRSKVVAFLPCRAGSVRVPHKNTRDFGASGQSLLTIKLSHLVACESIDEILVSTNDQEVKDVVSTFSRTASKKIVIDDRPDELGNSNTTTDSLIRYVPSIISEGHILWTHVTSPFAPAELYERAIARYFDEINRGEFDSLMSVTKVQTFLYDASGPVNFDKSVLKWPQTQTLPQWWEVNSAIFLVERDLCAKLGDRVGRKPCLFEMNHQESFDIDNQGQFDLGAKLWVLLHGN